jgi:hypothetical protein
MRPVMRHYHDIYATVLQQQRLPTMKGVWFESSEADAIEQTTVYSQMKMDHVKQRLIQTTQTKVIVVFLLPVPSLVQMNFAAHQQPTDC